MSIQPDDLSEPFVLEGTLNELHTEVGRQNLLGTVFKHYKGQGAITGVATATSDLFGMAANSAMLAMYDGENTESFVCLIDDQVVCGTFGGASKLREGGRVKAVVSRQNDVLVAHAILSDEQGYLWIKHPYGVQAERMANFKLGAVVAVITTVGTTIFDLISGPLEGFSHIEFTLMMAAATTALCLGMALWANSDMKTLAGPSTEMFRMLGFSDPRKVNLNSYSYNLVRGDERRAARERQHQYENVYCYKKAIEDGKIRMAE